MIRRGEAVRFDGLTEGGRNRPLKVLVELVDCEVEVYLKPSGRPEVGFEGMANEVFAACVANHLNLPVCEPILVDLTPEWIASIKDASTRQMLNVSCPVAFGSISTGPGWRKWQPDDILPAENRTLAKGIFAFDAFTENHDRTQGNNPNLLVRADEFRLIDHELSFRIRMQLFPPPSPWSLGGLNGMVGHALLNQIRRSRHPDVIDLRPQWASLSDEALSYYESLLPAEWQSVLNFVNDAKKHLNNVRERLDDCLDEVQRVLT